MLNMEAKSLEYKLISTLHIQNTRATVCYDPVKPSPQAAQQLLAPLIKERIAQDVCILRFQRKSN